VQFVTALLYVTLSVTSLFLICLVLIQRGKGGGLAGAFGGAGGSSAFGTKAGDVFTRVTMITAAIWISQAMLLVIISNNRTSAYSRPAKAGAKASDFTPAKGLDLDKAGTKGASKDLVPDLPPPPPQPPTTTPSTGTPVPDVSGKAPALPLPSPAPKDAPPPTSKP
jgi:preprotein translocase subunit SecG